MDGGDSGKFNNPGECVGRKLRAHAVAKARNAAASIGPRDPLLIPDAQRRLDSVANLTEKGGPGNG